MYLWKLDKACLNIPATVRPLFFFELWASVIKHLKYLLFLYVNLSILLLFLV